MEKYNNSYFYILEGNNGATYIINTTSAESINLSLKFYKATTIKQKVMKNALNLYLNGLGQLCKIFSLCGLKSQDEIQAYLQKRTAQKMNFALDDNCSILISPTRDKIIVHHHGECFHKFAFGSSYANVKNEAKIYELLKRPLQNFEVSRFYDYADKTNESCSFRLSSKRKSVETNIDMTAALVEMFNVSKQDKYPFSTYLDELSTRYEKSGIDNNFVKKVLNELKDTDVSISLGLVHRDFKHWNINIYSGLLIYDFEEAVTNGPPLEDLFNYTVAPIINYVSSSEVVEQVFKAGKSKEYKRYLNKMNIDLDYRVLLYCYVIERIVFYAKVEDSETRHKYINLLQCVEENKLDIKQELI